VHKDKIEEKQNGNKVMKKILLLILPLVSFAKEKANFGNGMAKNIKSQMGDGLTNMTETIYPLLLLFGVLMFVYAMYGLFIKEDQRGGGNDEFIKNMIYLMLGIMFMASKLIVTTLTK
jgi:hypothetical protein